MKEERSNAVYTVRMWKTTATTVGKQNSVTRKSEETNTQNINPTGWPVYLCQNCARAFVTARKIPYGE